MGVEFSLPSFSSAIRSVAVDAAVCIVVFGGELAPAAASLSDDLYLLFISCRIFILSSFVYKALPWLTN